MSKVSLGLLLAFLGAIGLAIAGIKLYVIGYYDDELPTYAVIGAVGAVLAIAGSKLYRTGKAEG